MTAAPPSLATTTATRLTGRTLLGLIVVFITQLMLVVDASIVNVALPHIQDELGFTAANLSWVVTSYALAFAGLILLSGRIGSMLGARRALMIGVVVFIAASALGGFAVNPEMLIFARVLQGIGAALAAPSTLVLLMANTVPGAQRNRAMSLFVLAAGSGGAIGLILGGVLTTNLGWEWVMFVNVPIGLVIIAGAIAFLRETERSPARLDVGGALTSTLAMVSLVYGFTTAAESSWTDPRTIAAFVVAAASLVALVLIERRHASPVVQLHYFTSTRTAVPFWVMLLVPAGMFGFFYFATLFTQNVLGYDPLGTGLSLLPFVGTMLVVNQFTPRLVAALGERVVTLAGLTGLAGGMLWMAQLGTASTFLTGILGPALVLGLGAGLTFAPITSIIMAQALRSETSQASSLLQGMQQLGGSIGVAGLTTVFAAITVSGGEARGIAAALLGGTVFITVGLVLFAVWGRRAPAVEDEATTDAASELVPEFAGREPVAAFAGD
ncbi:DHA2 family efflux MFS transporter permease subunit [Streptomyces sp. ISL-90]|nr:DHA2 family efflux MFS transporter permease subunit [Streptomyces sp. ISL-90]